MRFILAFVLGVVVFSPSVVAATKPNVLFICIDDLKPLLGCYGEDIIKSPNIDALAARGMRFDFAYCNQAVCGPSRNSLLTGLRPQTIGIYNLGTNFRKAVPDAISLPQFFKNHGYHTEALGKIYHTGHGNKDDKASWSKPHWRGKNIIYALPESRTHREDKTKKSSKSPLSGSRKGKRKKSKYGAAFESADVPDSTYAEGQLADKVLERLKAVSSNPDKPFFMAIGFLRPHLPFNSPMKYWDIYDRSKFKLPEFRTAPKGAPEFAVTRSGELRQYGNIPRRGPIPEELQLPLIHGYYAAVSYVDAQVGRVLKALEENGLAENTIVVVWGDHGWHLGDHGMWCKHTNYEQAARIPLIIYAPNMKYKGSATDAFVETVDIYPTLCGMAGLPAPKDLDGKSFLSVIENPSTTVRDSVIHVYPRRKFIGQAVRTKRYRLVEWKKLNTPDELPQLELYDYQEDPKETVNLASERTEVVVELRKILNQLPVPKPQIK